MLPSIAKHAKEHGITALKSLGQNFIFDMSLCKKIAEHSNVCASDYIIEIGPGTAGLTRAILEKKPQKMIVIERDQRCINLLKDIEACSKGLEIIEGDALSLSVEEIMNMFYSSQELPKVKIVANLPYNIATQLIINWLGESEHIDSIYVMLQKEVADRICSKHSTKSYGRLSIICQLVCDVKKLFDVSPESFYPRPKIWSSIVSLVPKKSRLLKKELELLSKVTHDAFGMRRKMLKTSLKNFASLDLDSETSSKRAEDLTPQDYINLVRKILN